MPIGISYGLAFLAVLCYSILTLLVKKFSGQVPPFVFISIAMFVLFCLSTAATFIVHRNFSLSSVSPSTWAGLIGFGVLNFIAFSLYVTAIALIPAKNYQLIYVISPLIVAVLSYFFLKEPIDARFLVGFVFVALGLYIALFRRAT